MNDTVIKDYTVIPNENADPRNYKISRFVPGKHPIDDVEFMLELPEVEIIKSQVFSSCVGHAFAMAKAISEYQKTRKWFDFDPHVIYGTRYEGEYSGRGMMLDQGAKVLYKEGAFYKKDFGRIAEMPLIKRLVESFKNDNPALVEAAKAFKIEGYAYIDPMNITEVQTALKAGMPVVVAIDAASGMGGSSGIVHFGTKFNKDTGLHAVCIVGWRTINDRPYWIMINSWGIYEGYKGLVFWDSKRPIREGISITDTITPIKKKFDHVVFSPGLHVYRADGEEKYMDVAPYIKHGRTYLPVRFVAENLGASVEWNAETGVATIRSEEAVLTITHKSNIMTINGVEYPMDVKPEIVNNRMMAPIRYIAEALLCEVTWLSEQNMVLIEAL